MIHALNAGISPFYMGMRENIREKSEAQPVRDNLTPSVLDKSQCNKMKQNA
jgi:hypothetical protein